jgi:hypothetical protein
MQTKCLLPQNWTLLIAGFFVERHSITLAKLMHGPLLLVLQLSRAIPLRRF